MPTLAYLRVTRNTQDVNHQRLAILEFTRRQRLAVDAFLTHDDYSLVRQTDAPLIVEAAAAGVGVLLGRVLLTGLLAGSDPLANAQLATQPDAGATGITQLTSACNGPQ